MMAELIAAAMASGGTQRVCVRARRCASMTLRMTFPSVACVLFVVADHEGGMSDARELDVIVYGASGFTGRLVAEYMQRAYGVGSNVTWAMAGRDTAKLDRIKANIGAS